MEEQESNSHLADFLEVLQDQHREIKNIVIALERIATTENPTAATLDRVAKEIADIKWAQHEIMKSKKTTNTQHPLVDKIKLFLDIATEETRLQKSERQADILVKIKSRTLILWLVVSLLIGVLGLTLSLRFWNENHELKKHDLKYRYYRMTSSTPLIIDSLFHKDPDGFKTKVEEMEYEMILSKELKKLKNNAILDSNSQNKKRKTNN